MKPSKRKVKKPGELYNRHKKHHKLPIQSTSGYRYSVNKVDPLSDTFQSAATHPFNPLYAGNSQYEDPKGASVFTKKRSGVAKRKKKHKLRKVDNKMRSFGDFDEKTGIIRINKKMNKKRGKPGELINTIVHEEYHKRNPKATEKKTYKVTKRIVKKLTPKAKQKLYAKYK